MLRVTKIKLDNVSLTSQVASRPSVVDELYVTSLHDRANHDDVARTGCETNTQNCSCVPVLFHDLLLLSYLYHCVWSVIIAHNLTQEKRDNNYSPHPLTPLRASATTFNSN